ncbi:hypothetical protein GGI07_005355 [Coemansia sp. Benny D115]|nr:hypothetical protein GGI07_005355 [Coemansia sp. Benny D115]
MSFPAACCNTPPVKADYAAQGTTGAIGDMPCYFAGKAGSQRAILVNYDVFGYHANVKQLCDILGASGFRVALPDLLRGNYLTEEDLGKPNVFSDFAAQRGSWSALSAAYAATRDHLVAEGARSVGVLGFCWGGSIVVKALSVMEGVASGAIIHPAAVTEEAVAEIAAPLFALLSKHEPDYTPMFAAIEQKPFFDKCRLVRFDDMFHGFCGARGDWANPEQSKRANEAIAMTVEFFNNTL